MSTGDAFLKLFSRSPIGPIQAHMQEANQCAQLLPSFIEAANQQDWTLATSLREDINTSEEKADQLKIDLRSHLPAKLLLPIPRMDLLQLISTQDKIANLTKDISGIMIGRKMVIPTQLASDFSAYVKNSCAASEQAKCAIDDLDVLLESGFKGKAADLIDSMISELNKLEKENDDLQIRVRQALFAIENELSPVDVVFLYKIITWVGDIADSAQNIGSKLKMMVAD